MNFITFFNESNKVYQTMVFMLVFLVCMNLEHFFGVSDKSIKFKNVRTNLLFILPGFIFQNALGILFVKILLWENLCHFGLLGYLGISTFLGQIVFSFIVIDFFYWVYHFFMHKFGIVWRFHAVHHSDKVLNVSTSLREHPIETIIRLSHYMVVCWILGPIIWLISLHQFIQVISKIIIHSNWRLPDKIDNYLSWIILTPNMHHVHHHEKQPYTDSNFGDLFSIWDRLFGTFRYLPKEEVVFGLDVIVFEDRDSKYLKFKELMKIPFSDKNLSS